MVSENVGALFSAIVTGVMAGLVLRLAQIISSKIEKDHFWIETLMCIAIIMVLAIFLLFTFR
jgi:hypothetical protein